MIVKQITWFSHDALLACDARCDKAWGINNRPKIEFDPDEPDDYAFLPDHDLGIAPDDPGTYEGGHAKPVAPGERLNKWCARECERHRLVEIRPGIMDIDLPDYSKAHYNMPDLHKDV
jgi:hypothetical protein